MVKIYEKTVKTAINVISSLITLQAFYSHSPNSYAEIHISSSLHVWITFQKMASLKVFRHPFS